MILEEIVGEWDVGEWDVGMVVFRKGKRYVIIGGRRKVERKYRKVKV